MQLDSFKTLAFPVIDTTSKRSIQLVLVDMEAYTITAYRSLFATPGIEVGQQLTALMKELLPSEQREWQLVEYAEDIVLDRPTSVFKVSKWLEMTVASSAHPSKEQKAEMAKRDARRDITRALLFGNI